ncbi:branched-chain amino acid ABC transporter permease [Bosea sp. BK604]|uniref:branched-chain amino acid ABC transporter permease n=1 Tax=Bosea sp. BK604 TaxID=2512180 RepID=UPI001049A3BF|nr:branched-chain amino acid ABC transporter permease [Bosea sp. BK604]TCR64767.1 amino acid/amide ABC transporter membrane protein 2 (HAAT family) [Bosea sp. BK604]
MDFFNPTFWTFVATLAGIYAILSLGLYVQFSMAGLPNFGHVAFMAIAAYAMAILVVRYGWPLPWALLASIVAAVLFALLLGIPTLRLRADYLTIATVAGGEIVRYMVMNFPEFTGGSLGSMGLLGPANVAMYNTGWQTLMSDIGERLGLSRDTVMLLVIWGLTAFLLLAFWQLEHSPWGRVLKAIREDETAVTACGKNVFFFKLQALVLGAILGAGAGLLLALQIGVFSPDDYQPTITFYAYLILILGGLNRIWAIPVGAILFSLLYTGTRFLNFYPLTMIDSGSRAFLRLFLVGLLLVIFVAMRPQGIFGNKREMLLEK